MHDFKRCSECDQCLRGYRYHAFLLSDAAEDKQSQEKPLHGVSSPDNGEPAPWPSPARGGVFCGARCTPSWPRRPAGCLACPLWLPGALACASLLDLPLVIWPHCPAATIIC